MNARSAAIHFPGSAINLLLPLTLPGPLSLIRGPLFLDGAPFNLDSAVEQQRHEGAKVGNKGRHGISPKLEAPVLRVAPQPHVKCSGHSPERHDPVKPWRLADAGDIEIELGAISRAPSVRAARCGRRPDGRASAGGLPHDSLPCQPTDSRPRQAHWGDRIVRPPAGP